MSHDIITKSCAVQTNRQRLRAYQERLDNWLDSAPAQAELIAKPVEAKSAKPNNISKFLRRGAK